jgi:hypothetical protein
VFVDDDNVLASDYLASVQRIATDHEFLGAWSGSVAAEFEESPPEWTKRYWGNLVIREVTRDAWSNLYDLDATTPLGAGLCVRRTVAQYYLNLHATGSRAVVLDRTGTNMVSGGDNDLAACALDMGYATGVIASLKLTHLIPRERLTEDYLLRLMEGVAYSSRMLKSFRPETAQFEKARGFSSRAADLARRVRMTSREKRFQDALMRGEMRARAELRRS